MFFSFCELQHVLSILRMRRGTPPACLTLIYRQPMTWIAAASEACGSVCCAVYTSRGEAAASCLGLPLPQVYFQLYKVTYHEFLWNASMNASAIIGTQVEITHILYEVITFDYLPLHGQSIPIEFVYRTHQRL